MLESTFEKKCVKELRELPYSYWPDKLEASSIRGIPDRIGCVCGMYIAIEFKKNKEEARKNTGRIVLQKKTLEEIKMAQGLAFIVYPENWDETFQKIQRIVLLNRSDYGQIRDEILRGRTRT